jgi:hypothetical protein
MTTKIATQLNYQVTILLLLRGQDSDLLRKLMGLPGKPFPTLPRKEGKSLI